MKKKKKRMEIEANFFNFVTPFIYKNPILPHKTKLCYSNHLCAQVQRKVNRISQQLRLGLLSFPIEMWGKLQ